MIPSWSRYTPESTVGSAVWPASWEAGTKLESYPASALSWSHSFTLFWRRLRDRVLRYRCRKSIQFVARLLLLKLKR